MLKHLGLSNAQFRMHLNSRIVYLIALAFLHDGSSCFFSEFFFQEYAIKVEMLIRHHERQYKRINNLRQTATRNKIPQERQQRQQR